jgi:hypothetical protein
MKGKAFILLLICFNFYRYVYSALTSKPENTVGVAGSQLKLRCQSNISSTAIYWQRGSTFIVSSCDSSDNGYQVDSSQTDHCDLVILSLSETLAGTYQCNDGGGPSNIATAYVILISSQNLTFNSTNGYIAENDTVELTCSSSFYPSVAATGSVGFIDSVTSTWSGSDCPSTSTTDNVTGTTDISVRGNTVALAQLSKTLQQCSCTTQFSISGVDADNVLNISQETPASINISFAPANVMILYDTTVNITKNTEFTCRATSYPEVAEFTWTVSAGNEEEERSGRTIELGVTGNFSLTCNAKKLSLRQFESSFNNQNAQWTKP